MSDARLIDDRRCLCVEVLESLVRSYLVRASGAHDLVPGERLDLVIADNPPVACTVEALEGDDVRLRRGWGLG